jgi:hypothetical protein
LVEEGMSEYIKHSYIVIGLIRKHGVRVFAEIGVLKGRTSVKILKALGSEIHEYWGIDPWTHRGNEYGLQGPYVPTKWEDIYIEASRLQLYFPQLRLVRTMSKYAVNLFGDGYFDMVYIDGDHHYETVISDIELWLPKVREGGVLAGHDYGGRIHTGVKPAVDMYFGEGNVKLLGDGVWLHERRV